MPAGAIVRGYLIGSGWNDYRATGAVCGIVLPPGLRQAQRLPEPIFTPSTKAAAGTHDENISFDAMAKQVGGALAEQVRAASLALYRHAARHAEARGIIIADTKFEFGLDADGTLRVMDEILTPDSSRFWPADQYEPGRGQPSFDKQYVRDWVDETGWDHSPPGPELPAEVVEATRAKYVEAYERIAGQPFERWLDS